MSDTKKQEVGSKKIFITTLIKYLFSIVVILLGAKGLNWYLFFGVVELAIIIVLSNILLRSNHIGWFVNSILLLLLNTQMVFLLLSNSYIVLIFLNNIDSIHGLSGRVFTYTLIAFVTVVASFLPIKRLRIHLLFEIPALIVMVLGGYYAIIITGGYFSPFYGYKNLYSQYRAEKNILKRITSIEANSADFYNESVSDYREKESDLPEQPNIVLIFAEGLSQQIVDDDRDIMPYVKSYEEKSLFFVNYYNQTAATYRGLSAQLYSGFQFQNYDKNELISIQDVLENEGYTTTFINAEPENAVFTKYLHDMDFNNLISDKQDEYKGYSNTLSDKEIYDLLFETIEEQSLQNKPFLTVVYTYGTHVSLDSIDEKFEDGSNPELNKFYDMDCQFGNFMEKFNRSNLSEDTMVIFTTDHCTYNDDAFANSFPEVQRDAIFFDRIPLFIYYKGIKPEIINADGRTSVDLGPTILDYLDISESNYFLGDSLFRDGGDERPLEKYYIGTGADYYCVKDGIITKPILDEVEVISNLLERYYALKLTPLN